MDWKIIESDVNKAEYDIDCIRMIVENEKGERYYMQEGFGGMDTMSGGYVRWRHGLIIRIKQGETFSTFEKMWNEGTTHRSAMLNGYDDERPVLEWSGHTIEKIANAAHW